MRSDIKSVVVLNNGSWFEITGCTVIFDVEITDGELIPKESSRAAHLEEICIIALRDAIKSQYPLISSWKLKPN